MRALRAWLLAALLLLIAVWLITNVYLPKMRADREAMELWKKEKVPPCPGRPDLKDINSKECRPFQ